MSDDVIELLADVEHERWSKWMRWMFDNWTETNVARWKQQMHTAYADLPEHSKESDRKEAHTTEAALHAAGYSILKVDDSAMIARGQAAYERGEKWRGIVAAMLDAAEDKT